MDLEKQKRNQLIRVVLTEILMVLAIIPIVVMLTLLAMGYRLGEDLSLEQSGLVQVNSIPNGATVKVDGEDKFKTDASRMLTGGEHLLEISKEGYDTWSKKVNITPGLLLRVRYPRLFKRDRKSEQVLDLPELKVFSAAPSRTRILTQAGTSPIFELLNIRGDEVKTDNLDLTNILQVSESGEFTGAVSQVRWSWNSDAILLKVQYADKAEWVLVDTRDNVPNRNLTKDFGLAISDVQFSGDSTERIYILENNNLREINLSSNGISKVLLSSVEEFYAKEEYIGYVGTADAKRIIGIYHNGDDGGVMAAEITTGVQAHVIVNEYFGEKYLGWTVDQKLVVYEGENFPTYGGDLTKMRLIIDADIAAIIDKPLVVNRTGEAIIAQSGQTVVAVDLETKTYSKYEVANNVIRFIDDYLLFNISDGELMIFDFDGENRRQLAKNVLGFSAVISSNNHWLYYVSKIDDKVTLVRERIN